MPSCGGRTSPFLYGLKLSLTQGGKAVDAVESYFGMRKIALGKDDKGFTRMLLNGKFVFQSGPLDQGFWPDGIYTAPTDEALRYDIEIDQEAGLQHGPQARQDRARAVVLLVR